MPRRMSCSMTVPAVRSRVKTATRRHVDTWKDLKVGDELVLIEKGMGLPKGARQVVLARVVVTDVRVEELGRILDEGPTGVAAEGLDMSPAEFVRFWQQGHGYSARPFHEALQIPVRRIEWRYLDGIELSFWMREG